MKGHRPQAIRVLIGLALGLGATNLANAAASLGPIQVNSYMGQPLNAAIRVDGLSPSNAQGAVVTLADNAEYSKRGVVKTPEQSSLAFRLVPSGNAYTIAVSSAARMNEPFVNFVLTFRSGGEVHTREYSVFLDPDPAAKAGIAPVAANIAATPAVTASPNPALQPASANAQGWGDVPQGAQRVALNGQNVSTAAAPTQTNAEAASAPRVNTARVNGNRYGPVGRGETLYSIANATRPSHVSVQTMMRAIFNANRRAFANNSMDSLMAGQTLVIPSDPAASASKRRKSTAADSEETRPRARHSAEQIITKAPEESTPSEEIVVNLNDENKDDAAIRPVEMTEEEIAQAQAQAEAAKLAVEEKQQESLATEPSESVSTQEEQSVQISDTPEQAQENTSAMLLDDANTIDANPQIEATPTETVVEPETTEEEIATQNAEEQNEPTEPATVEVENKAPQVVESTQEQTPPPVSINPTPVNDTAAKAAPTPPPVATNTQEDEGFLFGLPLWAVGAISALLLALLVLAVLAALKKRKTSDEPEMSEEEIQALAMSIGAEDEQRLAALINDEPTDKIEHNYSEQSEYDREFFSNDDSSAETNLSLHKSETNPVEEKIDELDDFFADADAQAQAQALENIEVDVEPQVFDDLDDFFSDDHSEATLIASSTEHTTTHHSNAFTEVEDFFTDIDADTQIDFKKPAIAEDNFEDLQFDDLDDFLSETNTDDIPEQSSSQDNLNMDLIEDLDFFADSSSEETSNVTNIEKTEESVFEDISADSLSIENTAVEKTVVSSADIEAMSINLDLAAAYIDSGIKPEKVAKVRTWLEEVLEKGSEEQQKIATDLIKKLPE